MSINTAVFAARIATAGVEVAKAQNIISETIALITMAEQVYEGLNGNEKFLAVEAGVKTLIGELGLSDKVDALWGVLGPIVSLIVTIFNLRKLWPAPAPTAPAQ